MYTSRRYAIRSSSLFRALARRWRDARLSWWLTDKEPWAFGVAIALIVTVFGFGLWALIAHQDGRRDLALQEEKRNLTCLAWNVYFEARGEPLAGQYAVAEVTMNRLASGRFPGSVCGVVYEKRWDPLRKRYVGAFSWTELDRLPAPAGKEWERARNVAEAVYYLREPPRLEGAMYYHAAHIQPEWAREKRRVTRIGRHIFYK